MGVSSTTANRSGIFWSPGKSPLDLAQKFSIAEEALGEKAEDVVTSVVDQAKERMLDIIDAGGMRETQKGGARRLSDKMYNSVSGSITTNARSRVVGEFGFGESAPLWAKFQERGTHASGPSRASSSGGGGIAPMLAYATALAEAITEMQNKINDVQWFATSKRSSVR